MDSNKSRASKSQLLVYLHPWQMDELNELARLHGFTKTALVKAAIGQLVEKVTNMERPEYGMFRDWNQRSFFFDKSATRAAARSCKKGGKK